jgi:hypothetical protein
VNHHFLNCWRELDAVGSKNRGPAFADAGSGNFTWPISAATLAQSKLLILRRSTLGRRFAVALAKWSSGSFHLRIFGLKAPNCRLAHGPAQLPKWAKYDCRNQMRRHRHNLRPEQFERLTACLHAYPALEVIYRFSSGSATCC